MSLRIDGAGGSGGIAQLTYASPTLSLDDGTTAQSFRVYFTDDGAGNASWIEVKSANAYWTACSVTTEASGTGVARSLALGVAATGPAVLLQNGGSDGILYYNGGAKLAWAQTAVTLYVPITLPVYAVATLPAGVVGQRAMVSDATAPVFLGALVGGGATTCPVFYDGAAWRAG